jgi:hypothetical protein
MTTFPLDHYDPRPEHRLIDQIREQEIRAQIALDKARECVRHLKSSVIRLKEQRLSLVELDA